MEMSSHTQRWFPIVDASQVGNARRGAAELGRIAGLDETKSGNLALVVTELATNILKHATKGELLGRVIYDGRETGVELLALDKGPGMVDIARCLSDGYSTAGSPGNGLGAISRLSSFFDLYSLPGEGSALLCRVQPGKTDITRKPHGRIAVGIVCIPMQGESVCGDGWDVHVSSERVLAVVADGLGHGPLAAQAAHTALRIIRERPTLSPKELIATAHDALRSTRGCALAVAEFRQNDRTISFAGIGNISAAIISNDASQSMASLTGTVGHELRKIQMYEYEWPKNSTVVLHSDGIGTRWKLDRYRGIAMRDPSLLAGLLYRDFTRNRDDVTVLAVKDEATA